ncbi:hypothetical protein NEHOM01_1389 [Nematocida homosporus]|uniref:uncharacterized protein n=1 Tax=Nematocida homosporus TaxID=1912981 RepID=UPI00221F3039|nr:uncharacterized protein NEHOM01_1389 [Nematocida homosporus]KAI5186325.1 hypothetical protein NEHOM01_1389 [Nematocida homosporus]
MAHKKRNLPDKVLASAPTRSTPGDNNLADAFTKSQPSSSTIANGTDQFLLNQMKSEIRRLYGEKVNMANTSYILKPHEFKCLARILSKSLWGEERALDTVDDLIYAVDALCNRTASQTVFGEPAEQSPSLTEASVSVRFVTGGLKALLSSDVPTSPKTRTFKDDISSLAEAKDLLQKRLETTGHANLDSLIAEKERLQKSLAGIIAEFSIPPGENLLAFLRGIKRREEQKYAEEVFLREKGAECQKRHYEKTIAQMKEQSASLVAENRTLKRLLKEKEASTTEVLQASTSLEETVAQIKQTLEEEEKRANSERKEYSEIKKSLIEQNRKMRAVVQELINRIKQEKKEKEDLMALQKTTTEQFSIQ